jgi:putative endonuclease
VTTVPGSSPRPAHAGNWRQTTGARGEDLAAAYLAEQGYVIERRNVRTRYGEIDLVAREGETLVFVEVRCRHGESLGSALESLTPRKRERMRTLAEAYLQTLPEPVELCRIDVVAIALRLDGTPERIDLVRDAV